MGLDLLPVERGEAALSLECSEARLVRVRVGARVRARVRGRVRVRVRVRVRD